MTEPVKHADLSEPLHGKLSFEFSYLVSHVRLFLDGSVSREVLAEVVADCDAAVSARREAEYEESKRRLGGAS